MPRFALVDKATGKVLNVIEADETFINAKPDVYINETEKVNWNNVYVMQSEILSTNDLVIDNKIYRYVSDLGVEGV